jgi:TRAP transporter 4TM/12TM fusion protein
MAAFFGQQEARIFRTTVLTISLVMVFLLYPFNRNSWKDKITYGFIFDLLLISISLFMAVYTVLFLDSLMIRTRLASPFEIVFGLVMFAIVFEATRRCMSKGIVILGIFLLIQNIFSEHMFWIFYGKSTSLKILMENLFIQEEGLFGIVLGIASNLLVVYFTFAVMLQNTGLGDFLVKSAYSFTGHKSGGPAKASVIGSLFFGMIAGSAYANVATTGSFTIPMMKKVGYPAHFAGAVEAVSSSGGTITPPVLGVIGFLLAEFLGISYAKVALIATIPALLYYFSFFFVIHAEAKRLELEGLPKETLPQFSKLLRESGHMLIPLVMMIALLMIGYSPIMSGSVSIVAILAVCFMKKSTFLTPKKLIILLEKSAIAAAPIVIACSASGIILGAINSSGIGESLGVQIASLSEGQLWSGLAIAGLACILMGSGLHHVVVYLLMLALVIPNLINAGALAVPTHLFIVYMAILSEITPPVAIAAFVAASIAGTTHMKVCITGLRLGLIIFLLPWIFVYNPEIVLIGTASRIILVVVCIIPGVVMFASAMGGWFIRTLAFPERLLLLGSAILFFIKPGQKFTLIAVAISAVLVFLLHRGILSGKKVKV